MRRPIFLLIILLGVCNFVAAQNKQILYNFSEIPQSLMVNPGTETNMQWYAGVPLMSGISLQAGSSGISVDDLFANDNVPFDDKFRDRVINGLNTKDDLSGTYQIELLNAGFRGKNPDNFYSFGIYNEGDAIGYYFKDYALLGYEGNANNLNKKFDLGDFKTRVESLNVFHFGVNKKINNTLTLGVRGKLYSSILNVNSTKNEGFFVTSEGENNLLRNTINADLELQSSGAIAFNDVNKGDASAGSLIKRGLLGGDIGLGLDLGFTYHLNDQMVVTASVLDLGFVYHSTNVQNYTLKGNTSVEGVEIILPEAISNTNSEFWQELIDEVEDLVPFESNNNNYITFRPTKLYGSLDYNFGEPTGSKNNLGCDCYSNNKRNANRATYANSVGGQLYVINRPRGPQAALSAFYLRRLGNVMAVKAAYTVDKYSLTNIGLGVTMQAGPVNIYFMADNLLSYANLAASRYASFQFGINVISWGRR